MMAGLGLSLPQIRLNVLRERNFMFQTELSMLEVRKTSAMSVHYSKFSISQILAQLIAYLTLDRKCFPYQYFDVYRKL